MMRFTRRGAGDGWVHAKAAAGGEAPAGRRGRGGLWGGLALCGSIVLGGLGLAGSAAHAQTRPPAPAADAKPAVASAEAAPIEVTEATMTDGKGGKPRPPARGKPVPQLMNAISPDDPIVAAKPVKPAPAAAAPRPAAPRPAAPAQVAVQKRLPLAPTETEIRREEALRDKRGTPAGDASKPQTAGARLQDRATTTPEQRKNWPTHVDYHDGPSGPAGGKTAGDRKGAMMDASGPQQGVIRNRW